MNKLNKYLCYTSKTNLEYLSKLKIKNLKVIDEKLEFVCGQETYENLSKLIQIEAIEIGKNKLINLLRKNLITIIGIILIVLALINLDKSVTHIKFSDPDTYNQEVVDYLNKYLKKVGPFYYLKDNLSNINLDLRKTFYYYEWIGIRKNGSFLYLDISELKNDEIIDDKRIGSYYAEYDGIVKKYHIEKGIVLVQEEQYVAKGEKLISGQIPKYGGGFENVRAKGYVIAEVLRYNEFRFPKETIEIKKTGKFIKIREIYLFGKRISRNKNPFAKYDVNTNTKINFFNILKVNEVEYYEVKAIKNELTMDDAVKYAKSLVEKEFRMKKVSEFEKIIFNDLVKIELIDNIYYVKLITKTHQNIAKFIPDEMIDN